MAACIGDHLSKTTFIEMNRSFWARKKPVFLKGADGKDYPLTFSTDSEFGDADIMRMFLLDPESFKKFEKLFDPISVDQIKEALNVTDKQLGTSLILRKGVKRGLKKYRITDLNPHYFAKSFLASGIKTKNDEVIPLAIASMRKRKYPVQFHIDRNNPTSESVELTHESYEKIPKTFGDLITRLHSELKAPQTHLHMGMPSAAITREQANAVGMAIEAKITLRWAADSVESGEKLAYHGSVLRGDNARRGPVKLEREGFKKPTLSYDLEIRQMDSIEHGLELTSFASELASRAKSLKTFPWDKKFGGGHEDPGIGNIAGALEYAGTLLEKSPASEKRSLSKTLIELGRRVKGQADGRTRHNSDEVNPQLRKEIQEVLTENHVLELMDDINLYLEFKP